jgi:glycerate-2-kinase
MPSAASTTMTKMIETLPQDLQERVLEHMREYIEDIREETKWNESFSKSQNKLVATARQARKEIAEGKATPFDPKKL